jgi:hypothetical protein
LPNAVDRSQTTKIRALTDDIGRPHVLLITAGMCTISSERRNLVATGHRPGAVLADRAYDTNSLSQEFGGLQNVDAPLPVQSISTVRQSRRKA